jgi:flavin reductase (DIM6/NTAB) family NADH-FMN oxidoreductase RutF
MAKRRVDPFRSVYPTPAALITSVSAEGKPNIIALGEVFNVSLRRPPIVGIAVRTATYSHGLISSSREFVINFPTAAMTRETEICGSSSGRDTDKFAASGLTPEPASTVRPPLIAECPVSLECRVVEIRETGDHDLFLAEVLAAHADERLLDAAGQVLPERLDPLIFMLNFGHPGEYWSLGRKLGERGR